MIYKDPKNFIKKHFALFDLEKNEDRLRLRRTIKENLEKTTGVERIEKEYILHYLKKTYGSPINPISVSISNSQSPKKLLYKDFFINNQTASSETQKLEKNSAEAKNLRIRKSFLKNSFIRLKQGSNELPSPIRNRRMRGKLETLSHSPVLEIPETDRVSHSNTKKLGISTRIKEKNSSSKIETFTPRAQNYGKSSLQKTHSRDNVSKNSSFISRRQNLRIDFPSSLKIDQSKRISVLIRAVNSEKGKKFNDFKLFKLFS